MKTFLVIKRTLFIFLLLFIFFIPISISISQIFLFSSLILWVIISIKDKEKIDFPFYFWGIIGYSFFTILSAIFSKWKIISLKDSREIFLFLLIPLIYCGVKSLNHLKVINNAFLLSTYIASGYAIIYFLLKARPGERIRGFMGHYMTQAGLMLLIVCFSISLAIWGPKKLRLPWLFSFLMAFISLSLTLTRSAWIGVIFAIALILYFYNPKTLIALPIIILLFFLIAPRPMKERAISIFSLKDESNLDRIYLAQSGLRIIKDYPLLGIGPATFPLVYEKYRLPNAERKGIHLHNNLIQIAVERGIPALLSWLFFLAIAFFDLLKFIRRKKVNDSYFLGLSIAALGAIVGLFIAGMFEYNFGDSEIKMLFLFIITMPFCYRKIIGRET